MNANKRLERCILEILASPNVKRSHPKKILTMVRRRYSTQTTQQIVSKRLYYMTNLGILKLQGRMNGNPIFIIEPKLKPKIQALLYLVPKVDIDFKKLLNGEENTEEE